ncbi:MAG: hypothetical protein COW18_05610 [Zetaproteobacteria bacterium CG12_big_fil_rev_8_21_14_0_65_54_13]|nr:MAG: hypothetical protein COW18_05610 [Zetaproteobacteria bacterium CG12_big_fil_rev_8_21_14_0_65_54_13]PIX55181.1 MAG: hypothetical protein COZ50_04150 [Zetaproteobacteria bacterium CG_4_10_14_3_um_filter_54_28]PJA28476.1 MAG: hypothetical protein CO188_09405 [Zetaproteobacteria bacterium CG_4_9_14_3_um_filter_54_145]
MMTIWRNLLLMVALLAPASAWALDSYRFLHVSIDTPWIIFIFLFFMVFAPMLLMAVLYWRNALRREDDEEGNDHA